MRVLQINVVYPQGSTGHICEGIYDMCVRDNIECRNAFAHATKEIKDGMPITSSFDNHVHNRMARITMLEGCFSIINTMRFLRKVKAYQPDIIHLHNLHGNYVNIPAIIRFIKKHHIKTILTTHDCWVYTGYCKHFTIAKCNKWKTQCEHCPIRGWDKVNIFDNSRFMYEKKKNWFSSIEDLTIVAPSKWVFNIGKESFLRDKTFKLIYNGIDLEVFKPIDIELRDRYGCADDYIILGVAFDWGYRKGLDVFIELSKRLDKRYRIVLVGTNDEIDKLLPNSIISIHRLDSQHELAKLYSAADIFVNPTREEMFGMVNIEALACGTPVVTFDTGGSPECIDETCGIVVPCDDIPALEKAIRQVVEDKPFTAEACRKRAEKFDMQDKFAEYVQLYHDLCEKK